MLFGSPATRSNGVVDFATWLIINQITFSERYFFNVVLNLVLVWSLFFQIFNMVSILKHPLILCNAPHFERDESHTLTA